MFPYVFSITETDQVNERKREEYFYFLFLKKHESYCRFPYCWLCREIIYASLVKTVPSYVDERKRERERRTITSGGGRVIISELVRGDLSGRL